MLISLDTLPDRPVELGEMLYVVVVNSANVVKDIRENLRNLVGGRMPHYERLIEEGVAAALAQLDARALSAGYDGVIGVKITHPTVVDGGVEIVVYGNGFRHKRTAGDIPTNA